MDADNAGPTLAVLCFQGLSLSGSALKGEGDPWPSNVSHGYPLGGAQRFQRDCWANF